jgi:O-antigen ligase
MWLIYPLVIGSLGLLRDFWSWVALCGAALLCLREREPQAAVLPALAWSLVLAAMANAGYGMVQAYQLWRHTAFTDVYGLLNQRNQLATLCLMGLAATGWLAARGSRSSGGTAPVRRLAPVVAVALGATVSLSASRTGLLGLVLLWAASEVLVLRDSGRSVAPFAMRLTLRVAVLGYGLALIPVWWSPGHAVGILARQEAREGVTLCNSRLSLWANVLQLIGQKPWGGWGWGELDYAHFITLFSSARFCALLNNAHNLPLQLAVELGIPITLAFCALVVLGIWRAKPWQERDPDRLFAWAVLLPVGVHSMLEYPLWYGPFQVSTVLCLWILWRKPLALANRTAWQMAMAAGLAMATFLAADYYRASQIYLPSAQRLGMYRTDTQQVIQNSVFFQDQIDFATLGIQEVTAGNAEQMHALALKMLHFSPEAMVVQKLLVSTRLLGLQDEYDYYQQRFAAAYPEAFLNWKASQPGN